MSQHFSTTIAVMGIDIDKNSFHVVDLDQRGAIVLRQKWSRGQVESRFANVPPCLIGMEACVGAHYLSRKLKRLGHDVECASEQANVDALRTSEDRFTNFPGFFGSAAFCEIAAAFFPACAWIGSIVGPSHAENTFLCLHGAGGLPQAIGTSMPRMRG